jgi:hypothetical protein
LVHFEFISVYGERQGSRFILLGTKVERRKARDEPILVIIHINMEMSQGNSLCSYLKQTRMSFFFIYKIGEQEGRAGPA